MEKDRYRQKDRYRVYTFHKGFNGETMDYDLYRKSTRVTDPRGFIREYEYDGNGLMTKLTEPDGGIQRFDNTSDLLRYKKTDALKSRAGHIVVRVEPGGETFDVHILSNTDESDTVTASFGPYIS